MEDEDPDTPAFRDGTVHEIFKASWFVSGMKVTPVALHLASEYLRLFTVEAVHRAADEAKHNKDPKLPGVFIEVKHLENVAPSLLTDF